MKMEVDNSAELAKSMTETLTCEGAGKLSYDELILEVATWGNDREEYVEFF